MMINHVQIMRFAVHPPHDCHTIWTAERDWSPQTYSVYHDQIPRITKLKFTHKLLVTKKARCLGISSGQIKSSQVKMSGERL